MKIKVNAGQWPETATRSEWSRLTGIAFHVLNNAQRTGKLRGYRQEYNVMITKREMLRWIREHNQKLEEMKYQEA